MKKLETFLEAFQFVKGFDKVGRHRFFSATFSGLLWLSRIDII
jgi:hypothetical protein